MAEIIGVLAAALNTTLGGLAVGVTRYIISATDPVTLAVLRFGIGALVLLPLAMLQIRRWPSRRDLPGIAGLALLYFVLYPVLFNAALAFTTAVRGALALSTAPLLTMVAAAILGIEPLTLRKTFGVLIAILGVAIALVTELTTEPSDSWRGDLLMVGAALCSAFYSVWSRPFIERSGAVPYTVIGMTVGVTVLGVIWCWHGGSDTIATFGSNEWAAVAFLGVFGSALAFYLWTFALERTTPTRVATTMTLNPIAAGVFGVVVLDEQITWRLILGLVLVIVGISLAASRLGTRSTQS